LITYVRRTVCRIKGKGNRSKSLGYRRTYHGNICFVSGTMKGIQVQETLTFVGVPTVEKGIIHGIGKGVVVTTGGESEMVTYIGEGIGRLDSSGSIKWRGSVFFRTSSGDKLRFLNNLVGVFESEIDAYGNVFEKAWEWK
jgi:hypothetical protein